MAFHSTGEDGLKKTLAKVILLHQILSFFFLEQFSPKMDHSVLEK